MRSLIPLIFLFVISCSSVPKKMEQGRQGRFLANVDPAVALIYDDIVMDIAHNSLGNCLSAFRNYKSPQEIIDQQLIVPGKLDQSFLYLAAEFQYSKNYDTERKLARVIASLDEGVTHQLLGLKDPNKVKNTHLIHMLRYCNHTPPQPVDIYDLEDWIKEKKY